MGEDLDILSLRGAAQQAGVSENTMREWAKKIPGIERLANGGYSIPKHELMGFLASKQSQLRGPRPGASFIEQDPQVFESSPQVSRTSPHHFGGADQNLRFFAAKLEAEYQLKLEDQALQLKDANLRIKDLEAQQKELTATVIEQGRGIANTLATISTQLQLMEPRGTNDFMKNKNTYAGEVIDAEHVPYEVAPKARKKKKLKAQVKKRVASNKKSKKVSKVKPKRVSKLTKPNKKAKKKR